MNIIIIVTLLGVLSTQISHIEAQFLSNFFSRTRRFPAMLKKYTHCLTRVESIPPFDETSPEGQLLESLRRDMEQSKSCGIINVFCKTMPNIHAMQKLMMLIREKPSLLKNLASSPFTCFFKFMCMFRENGPYESCENENNYMGKLMLPPPGTPMFTGPPPWPYPSGGLSPGGSQPIDPFMPGGSQQLLGTPNGFGSGYPGHPTGLHTSVFDPTNNPTYPPVPLDPREPGIPNQPGVSPFDPMGNPNNSPIPFDPRGPGYPNQPGVSPFYPNDNPNNSPIPFDPRGPGNINQPGVPPYDPSNNLNYPATPFDPQQLGNPNRPLLGPNIYPTYPTPFDPRGFGNLNRPNPRPFGLFRNLFRFPGRFPFSRNTPMNDVSNIYPYGSASPPRLPPDLYSFPPSQAGNRIGSLSNLGDPRPYQPSPPGGNGQITTDVPSEKGIFAGLGSSIGNFFNMGSLLGSSNGPPSNLGDPAPYQPPIPGSNVQITPDVPFYDPSNLNGPPSNIVKPPPNQPPIPGGDGQITADVPSEKGIFAGLGSSIGNFFNLGSLLGSSNRPPSKLEDPAPYQPPIPGSNVQITPDVPFYDPGNLNGLPSNEWDPTHYQPPIPGSGVQTTTYDRSKKETLDMGDFRIDKNLSGPPSDIVEPPPNQPPIPGGDGQITADVPSEKGIFAGLGSSIGNFFNLGSLFGSPNGPPSKLEDPAPYQPPLPGSNVQITPDVPFYDPGNIGEQPPIPDSNEQITPDVPIEEDTRSLGEESPYQPPIPGSNVQVTTDHSTKKTFGGEEINFDKNSYLGKGEQDKDSFDGFTSANW